MVADESEDLQLQNNDDKKKLIKYERWYADCEIMRKQSIEKKQELDELKKSYKACKDTLDSMLGMGPEQYALDRPLYDLFDNEKEG